MDARLLARAGNVLLVVSVGMAAGHLAMPARPTASWAQRLAFVAALTGAGAVAGWREGREAALDRGLAGAPRPARWVVGGIAAALVSAGAGWGVVHG